MASEEAVIVVVGGETKYKAMVTEAFATARGASIAETTRGGARIFRKRGSLDAAVIDTTPLIVHQKTSVVLEMAEMWISLNALRRLYGKLMCVICVLPSGGPEDSIHCELGHEFNWLHLLGYIFAERKRNIVILVKLLEGTIDSGALRRGVTDALQRDGYVKDNVSFENMVAKDLILTVRKTLERSNFQCKSTSDSGALRRGVTDPFLRDGYVKGNFSFENMILKDLNLTITKMLERCGFQCRSSNSDLAIQFRLQEVSSKSQDLDRYGCWGPERVILLGRTGSGKSTLYQMLTKGGLDPTSKSAASSSIRGETKEITRGEGRGWYVIDTPGFGELKDKQSTISTEEAQRRIRKYVSHIEGTYSHFVYVFMKDRIDMLDEKLWKFFQVLFKRGQNFTVVISNADQTWVDQNVSALKGAFSGCENFVGVEFPPTLSNDAEGEAELAEVRGESLNLLERELASLSRFNTSYSTDDFSRDSIERIATGASLRLRMENSIFENEAKPMISMLQGSLRDAATVARIFDGLAETLKEDENFVLLPP